jgi:hypothetical protein
MDLYCPRCAEPCDSDEFHDIARAEHTTYQDVAARFRTEGCTVVGMNCRMDAATPGSTRG